MAANHLTFARKGIPADPPAAAIAARDRRIAEAAYDRAAARGFVPGHELEDWLAAERDVDAHLADQAHRR